MAVVSEAEAGYPEVSNTAMGYAGDTEPRYAAIGAAGYTAIDDADPEHSTEQ
ncbi:hypothetical protein L195_g053854, partial [Trifolium pratense]